MTEAITRWNYRRLLYICFFLPAAVLVGTDVVSRSQAFSKPSSEVVKIARKDNSSFVPDAEDALDFQNHKYDDEFSYDRERWNRHNPRVVVLAGPHKAASTTLQDFFVSLSALQISIQNNTDLPITNYPDAEWVWPVGIVNETDDMFFSFKGNPRKFYAPLTAFFSGRRTGVFYPKWRGKTEEQIKESRVRVANYFRSLFARPWKDGKKIVMGAESFDSLVMGLGQNYTTKRDCGEEIHVSPTSSDMIDTFLGFLPWDEELNSTMQSSASRSKRTPPLRLEDIEIHINYRTPRINHLVSIWHQSGGKRTLKKFVMSRGEVRSSKNPQSLYQLNSLALALQFVRKGLKTTIVDMNGVFEKESKNFTPISTNEKNATETVVGGLQGVVACDILKMGTDRDNSDVFCDVESKLHLTKREIRTSSKNKKKDRDERKLSDKQMEEINSVFEEYDCGVWQHLKKYQEKGLLRILYPSGDLFKTCNSSSPDISFYDATIRAQTIASRDEDE